MDSLQRNTLGHDLTDLLSALRRARRIAQDMQTEPRFKGNVTAMNANLAAAATYLEPIMAHRIAEAQIAGQPIYL